MFNRLSQWWKGRSAERRMPFDMEEFRAALQKQIRGRLDLTQTTHENSKHWSNADNLSARSAYSSTDRALCRDRSRYEAENNSWYSGMLTTVSSHTIGRGPRLQVLTNQAKANARVEKAWRTWARDNNFVEMLRVAVQTYWRDGEVFFLRRYRQNSAIGKVGLHICLYEGDQVTNPYAFPYDPYVDDGIRIDSVGAPIAYHILDHHPGDINVPRAGMLDGEWYDASDVIHLYRPTRPGQLRGIPRIAASLELFPKLRRHTLATLAAAEAVANWTLFVRTNSSAIEPEPAPSDFVTMDFARAMLNFLPEGWEPFQLKAEQPTTNHEMFQRQTLMEIARCAGMPFLLLAGTSKDSNYSSAQMDVRNIWGPDVVADQDRITVTLLEKVWGWFLEEALMVPGLLDDMPLFDDIEHQWTFDPLPSVDIKDEADAGQILLESGQAMPHEIYGRRNKDFDSEVRRGAEAYGVPERVLRQAIFATNYSQFALGEPDGNDSVVKKPRTKPFTEESALDDDMPAPLTEAAA